MKNEADIQFQSGILRRDGYHAAAGIIESLQGKVSRGKTPLVQVVEQGTPYFVVRMGKRLCKAVPDNHDGWTSQ